MKIILTIPDSEINRIAGERGASFVVKEFKRDPVFFVKAAKEIKADTSKVRK